MQDLRDDIRNEGDRQPVTIDLPRLNEDAVLEYVGSIHKSTPRYQIARNNCSHVVAYALMAGAQRNPSFTPHAGNYGRIGRVLGLGIWAPDQILRFAKELQGL